jgi:hypothetical protein
MTAMMVELTRNPMKSIHAIRAKVKRKYGFADSSDRRLSHRFDRSMGQSGFLSSPSMRFTSQRSIGGGSSDSGSLYHEERCDFPRLTCLFCYAMLCYAMLCYALLCSALRCTVMDGH